MVTVRFFAAAAAATGRREASGNWAGLTAGELLSRLAAEHPKLQPLLPALSLAVNRDYVDPSYCLQDGDEFALIPPVSGGEEPARPPLFEVVDTPLQVEVIQAKVVTPHTGAVVHFVGTVREWTKGRRTTYLEYEAYPEMAVEQMRRIAGEIERQWPGALVAISHRVGKLEIGEVSVVIAVGTPHRGDAFAACRHAIERLKQVVPIWKKEAWEDGEEWVGAQSGPAWMHPELSGQR